MRSYGAGTKERTLKVYFSKNLKQTIIHPLPKSVFFAVLLYF
jgi:hypothetical protein